LHIQEEELMSKKVLLLYLFLFNIIYATDAFAYIDPNTGGIFFQLLFPLLVAILGFFGILRNKVKNSLKQFFIKFQRQKK